MSRKLIVLMLTVILALLAVSFVAANDTPKPGTPEDNACNPGGVLYREQNQDGCPTLWYWKAGWYLARFLSGEISRANFPKEFESVLPPLPKQPKGMACSGKEGALVDVTFDNKSTTTVDIYWVDWSCNLVLYHGLVPAGQTRVQGTYVNHVWLVRRNDNQQHLYCFKVTGATTVTITDTPQNYC